MLLSMSRLRRGLLCLVVIAVLAVITTGSPAQAANGTFRNPVGTKPDPYMTYFDGNYYLTMTEGDSIKMHRSPTVAGLLNSTATTVWKDTDTSRNQQVWAPEFYQLDGKWYIYYTADDGTDENHRLYVAESDGADPMGPYHFKAKLEAPNRTGVFAIDPSLMQHNGKLYLAWAGTNEYQHNGINIAPMSNPYTVSGNAVSINAGGDCSEVREAPEFLYRNGKTWMTYSVCDTGKPDYKLWEMSIPTASDPLVAGNWTQHTGAVFSRSDAHGVYGPGHHAFFKSPDGTQDWMAYLAKATSTYTYDYRTTRIQQIGWNSDGSPNLGEPLAIGATQDLPSGDPGPSTGWINDDNRSSGVGSVAYTGTWSSGTGCGVQCFWSDDHYSGTSGATATFTFTGTQLALLSVRDTGNGIAAISVDGGTETRVDYYATNGVRDGEYLHYLSPKLSSGTHTVKVRVTGDKNASSGGTVISIDRAEVWTS